MTVLDTNVISELIRPAPSAHVSTWIDGQVQNLLFITTITLAESLYGIERLPKGRRKAELSAYFGEMLKQRLPYHQFLSFDARAAAMYAAVATQRERMGRLIETGDAQIAAICLVHKATLATHNIRDFEHTGVELINPWEQ